MTATAAQIAQVRRMIAESDATTYSDNLIATYIEAYPLMDELGEDPYTWDETTEPPHKDTNDDWIPTYDLNAAAADIWLEKASAFSPNYDFAADGGNYSRSQAYEQAMKQYRNYNAKRVMASINLIKKPDEPENAADRSWIVNMAEQDD